MSDRNELDALRSELAKYKKLVAGMEKVSQESGFAGVYGSTGEWRLEVGSVGYGNYQTFQEAMIALLRVELGEDLTFEGEGDQSGKA